MQLFASCVHVVPSNDFHSVSPQVPAAGVVVVDVVGVVVVVVGVVVVVVVVVGVVVEDEDDVDVVVGGPHNETTNLDGCKRAATTRTNGSRGSRGGCRSS